MIHGVTPGVAQRVLGLDSLPADPTELRSAWRRFALRNHPDRAPSDPTAGERFQMGRCAYEVLSERIERQASGCAPQFVPLATMVPTASREWRA